MDTMYTMEPIEIKVERKLLNLNDVVKKNIQTFIDEFKIKNQGLIRATTLYDEYKTRCKLNDEYIGTMTLFGKHMKYHCPFKRTSKGIMYLI